MRLIQHLARRVRQRDQQRDQQRAHPRDGGSVTRSIALAFGTLSIGFAALSACGVGDGQGSVEGTLDVDQCWAGPFNLQPDFFAAVPYRDTLQIRIQNGGDYETFSDGVEILVDSIVEVRGDATHPSHLCHGGTSCDELAVSLPAGVTEPGVPLQAIADPSIVHLTLYLQQSCHTQNAALYAMSQVSLGADGNCDEVDTSVNAATQCGSAVSGVGLVASADSGTNDGGDIVTEAGVSSAGSSVLAADAGADGGTAIPSDGPIGTSFIVFDELFDGNEGDNSASARLSEGHFDVYLADPREVCPGGLGPPPRCRGHLTGTFKFYFQQGRPGQPFPGSPN